MSYKIWQYLLYFLPFSIGTEVLFPVRVSTFEHPKSFLFSFHFAVLPFNLAVELGSSNNKKVRSCFLFHLGLLRSPGTSPCACLHCLAMGDCARALFVWLSSPSSSCWKSAWQFGSMAQAPQEQPSDKMSPWLCSTCPIGWSDALYTWVPEGQSTERECSERGGVETEKHPVLLILLHVPSRPHFVNCLHFIFIDKISFDGQLG